MFIKFVTLLHIITLHLTPGIWRSSIWQGRFFRHAVAVYRGGRDFGVEISPPKCEISEAPHEISENAKCETRNAKPEIRNTQHEIIQIKLHTLCITKVVNEMNIDLKLECYFFCKFHKVNDKIPQSVPIMHDWYTISVVYFRHQIYMKSQCTKWNTYLMTE